MSRISDEEWSHSVAAGEAFAGEGFQAAVAGEIPYVQLFNPVDSGVRIRVRIMQPMAVFAVFINTNIRSHDTPLASLGNFGIQENLLGGGPASVAEIRRATDLGQLGDRMWLILSAGNTRSAFPDEGLDGTHDLLEGEGIILNGTTGSFILCGWMWAEVPL